VLWGRGGKLENLEKDIIRGEGRARKNAIPGASIRNDNQEKAITGEKVRYHLSCHHKEIGKRAAKSGIYIKTDHGGTRKTSRGS